MKTRKLRKTRLETKKPVKQVKTRPKYTRRFLKPDSEKNAYWAGPRGSKEWASSQKSSPRAETRVHQIPWHRKNQYNWIRRNNSTIIQYRHTWRNFYICSKLSI
jgi:hypothetical protein